MSIGLGDVAPDFNAPATTGDFNLHEFLGNSWGLLFSYAKDQSGVCATELGAVAQLQSEFDERGVKIVAVSVDGMDVHATIGSEVCDITGAEPEFPIVSDSNRAIAGQYGFIHPGLSELLAARCTFIIDPSKKIRWMAAYPINVGRNFTEVLRCIDALQLADKTHVSLPAHWSVGGEVLLGGEISEQVAEEKFAGYVTKRPWFRTAKIS